MKVLGIDPGTHRIGWGIIEGNINSQSAIEYNCIELPKHTKQDVYLPRIYKEIKKLLTKHKPDLVGIEKIFFQKNKKTATIVAQARGVIILAVSQANTAFIELSPNTIKSTVAGSGRADKEQVVDMTCLLLNISEKPKLDDTTDALATAITALVIKGK